MPLLHFWMEKQKVRGGQMKVRLLSGMKGRATRAADVQGLTDLCMGYLQRRVISPWPLSAWAHRGPEIWKKSEEIWRLAKIPVPFLELEEVFLWLHSTWLLTPKESICELWLFHKVQNTQFTWAGKYFDILQNHPQIYFCEENVLTWHEFMVT